MIKNLSTSKITGYSLWKEIKHINKPTQRRSFLNSASGERIRSNEGKADAFLSHLNTVFQSYNDNADQVALANMRQFIDCTMLMTEQLQPITVSEMKYQIKRLNGRKATGLMELHHGQLKIFHLKAYDF